MNRLHIPLALAVMMTVGCLSTPKVVVTSSLDRHALKGKTLAVGGLSTRSIMDYPGQSEEETIVADAAAALQERCSHSRVLTAESLWAAAGPPPVKTSPGVPITIGHRLTQDFIRRTHAQGVDYLLWIDLLENNVRNSSGHRLSMSRGSSSTFTSSSGRRYYSPGTNWGTYYSDEASGRSLGASYALLDTASGRTVWRADIKYGRSRISSTMSRSGFPGPPARPLPPEESKLMQKMTAAALAELPK